MNPELKEKLMNLLLDIRRIPEWDREPAVGNAVLDEMIDALDEEN